MYFKTTFIALLASTAASPMSGAANTPEGLQVRQDDPDGAWAGFHELSETFQKTGNCRIYTDVKTERDGNWPCYAYCDSIDEKDGALGCFAPGVYKEGTTELKDPTFVQSTPDGEDFLVGECICSKAAKDKIGEIAGEILVLLGQNTCAVWLQATKAAIELLSDTPSPGGAIAKAVKVMAKIVTKIADADDKSGADRFREFVMDTCGTDGQWAEVDFKKAFEGLLKAAADEL